MYFEFFYIFILKVFPKLFCMQFLELRISKNSRSYEQKTAVLGGKNNLRKIAAILKVFEIPVPKFKT